MSKNYKLQNILFCDNDRLEAYWEMFFKSSRPVYDRENKTIVLGAGQVIDFCTYFNSISLLKWKTYTYAEKLILRLRVKGEMEIMRRKIHNISEKFSAEQKSQQKKHRRSVLNIRRTI